MTLADLLREQSAQCGRMGSPLYEALLAGAADDIDAGGPTLDLMAPHLEDPPGTVPGLRLAGSLHRLVLIRQAAELALHFPSVGGTAPAADVWPAARRTIEREADLLRELVVRPVQTNEVGRSAALLGGLLQVVDRWQKPVRLLEIGASAGLNLRVDAFAYEVGDDVLGDPASPMRLVQPWIGLPAPVRPVEVVARRGCDPGPLDPASEEDRLTLTSYVWGDQVERFERLRGALDVAARVPAVVDAAPAGEWLLGELAVPTPGVVTVVWQSVVRQYLSPDERGRVAAALASAGDRATPEAPLVHLSMEPQRLNSGLAFHVRAKTWPGGDDLLLGEATGHGPPVRWHPRPF